MKFFFLNIISMLFIISCEKKTDINHWPQILDDEFLTSCVNQSDQNVKYCMCILNKIKSDNFNLSIINFDNFLSSNVILQNIFNECIEAGAIE